MWSTPRASHSWGPPTLRLSFPVLYKDRPSSPSMTAAMAPNPPSASPPERRGRSGADGQRGNRPVNHDLQPCAQTSVDIPGYQLLEPIGEGGMGTVYRAVQESLQRSVAVKLLHVPA